MGRLAPIWSSTLSFVQWALMVGRVEQKDEKLEMNVGWWPISQSLLVTDARPRTEFILYKQVTDRAPAGSAQPMVGVLWSLELEPHIIRHSLSCPTIVCPSLVVVFSAGATSPRALFAACAREQNMANPTTPSLIFSARTDRLLFLVTCTSTAAPQRLLFACKIALS
jgi:hypothetical protein